MEEPFFFEIRDFFFFFATHAQQAHPNQEERLVAHTKETLIRTSNTQYHHHHNDQLFFSHHSYITTRIGRDTEHIIFSPQQPYLAAPLSTADTFSTCRITIVPLR